MGEKGPWQVQDVGDGNPVNEQVQKMLDDLNEQYMYEAKSLEEDSGLVAVSQGASNDDDKRKISHFRSEIPLLDSPAAAS